MASLRLKNVAHKAVAAALVLGVAQVEPPEHGDLPWVGRHALNERPDQHKKEEVEHGQQQDHPPVVCITTTLLIGRGFGEHHLPSDLGSQTRNT